jgi:putative oxidoreductase
MKIKDVAIAVSNTSYILVYVYAAVTKLILFQVFVLQMDMQPFDDRLTPWLVRLIPATELLLSLMLITPKYKKLGLILSTGLMLCFTAYIILIKLHFYNIIPCSCGGAIAGFTWTQHLIFNIVLLVLGGIGIYMYEKK